MRKLWRLVVRVVFWSYERGSLPYDLMVIAILLFVLLTPRHWFNDQPSQRTPAVAGQIRLVDVDTATSTELFRIDATLLAPPRRSLELEKETHELLSRSVSSLHGQMFQIVRIQAVRAEDGTVTGYDVRIKPTHSAMQ
jgi:hypothetical protein